MIYKCDECSKEHVLEEKIIKDKQFYVTPFSCTGGDYYEHNYYFFECYCGREIEVDSKHIKQDSIDKIYDKYYHRCRLEKQPFNIIPKPKEPKTYAEIFCRLGQLEHQLSEIGKIESNKSNSIDNLVGSLGNILKVGELQYQIDILKWILSIENE